MQIQL